MSKLILYDQYAKVYATIDPLEFGESWEYYAYYGIEVVGSDRYQLDLAHERTNPHVH